MRTYPSLFTLVFLAACSGGEGASPSSDAGVDAEMDVSSAVACSAQDTTAHGPSYVCGTCGNDGYYVPACVSGVLVCKAPSPPNLVHCECGVLGLNTGCCDACGHRAGSFSCGTSGRWECPAGLTACGRNPTQCVDGGEDAAQDGGQEGD